MSIYMHFRAVPAEAITEDHAWLTQFMLAAWERHSEEFASGITTSINKDFEWVHLLYAGAAEESWGEPNTLPIEGGHVIHDLTNANPPFLILDPDRVRATAVFLQTVSFDTRWHIAGPHLSAQIHGWNESQVKDFYRDHHHDLRDFYTATATAGHAVIKGFWV